MSIKGFIFILPTLLVFTEGKVEFRFVKDQLKRET